MRRCGPPVLRSYSLSTAGLSEYRISVKLEEHGLASAYIYTRREVRDVLELAAARGRFNFETG